MANRLEKKLQELESEIQDMIRIPVDPTPSNPRLQIVFDDITQRFGFLRKLLLQEMASQPQNSEQLQGIGQKLTALEDTWNEWRLHSVCSDCRSQTLLQSDLTHEADSLVSETGSFSADNIPRREDPNSKKKDCYSISDTEDFSGEKTTEKDEAVAGRGNMGKYGGVFCCGMIVGVVWMEFLVIVSYGYFFLTQNQAFLIPPT